MLDDIKKQIEFIKNRTLMVSITKDRIWFHVSEWYDETSIPPIFVSKKLYDSIIKDIEIIDENQFILAYGRDPFSLNEHQNYINPILEENNAKTSK